VQKKRVLKVSFEKKCNRVAEGGALWDPIALLAKGHIGITSYYNVHSRLNLETRHPEAKSTGGYFCSRARAMAAVRASVARVASDARQGMGGASTELLARLGVAAAAAAVVTALWLRWPPPWLLARWIAPEVRRAASDFGLPTAGAPAAPRSAAADALPDPPRAEPSEHRAASHRRRAGRGLATHEQG